MKFWCFVGEWPDGIVHFVHFETDDEDIDEMSDGPWMPLCAEDIRRVAEHAELEYAETVAVTCIDCLEAFKRHRCEVFTS